MSLVKTLAKAAIGIAIAKGVGSAVSGGTSQGAETSRGHTPGRGTPYGTSNSSSSALGGSDLVDVLGKMLGGSGPRGMGSLEGALEDLSRVSTNSFTAPRTKPGQTSAFDAPKPGSFGELLDQSLDHYGEPPATPTAKQEELAAILLRALIQSAKADGRIDPGEKEKLLKNLGKLDHEELDFVNAELAKPIDVPGLAREIPKGAEAQVYMMSVMGIDLDTNKEAKYLAELAQAIGMSPETANAIHDRLGEPRLFR